MNKMIKLTAAALVTTLIATSAFAQDVKEKTEKSKKEKTQEIVIRKNSDKAEKMTIVVEGDNVTINGKPVDEFKNADVTVFRRDHPMVAAVPRVKGFRGPHPSFDFDGFSGAIPLHGNKAMLGVVTQRADDGVRVSDVTKESGAEKAGLKKDDIITKAGTTDVREPGDLIKAISELKPNDKVDITYKRDGKENKTSVTLGENKSRDFAFNMNSNDFNFDFPKGSFPGSENFNFNFNRKPRIGLQIQDVEEGKGVTVKDVDEESPASKAGIKEGDVITQVNGKDIAGVDELREEIKDAKEGDTVKFSYKRDGQNKTAEIKLPKRLKSADL